MMSTQVRHSRLFSRIICFITLIALTLGPISPSIHPAKAFDPFTIGALIGLGKLALDKLHSITQDALVQVGDQAIRLSDEINGDLRDRIDQITQNLESLISTLSSTYQEDMSLTVDAITGGVGQMLQQAKTYINQIIDQLNVNIQEDISLISIETQNVINSASQQMQVLVTQITSSVKDIIIVARESTVYVLDRATYDGILIIALILLGVGLLIFVALMFTGRLPQGFPRLLTYAFMLAFVVLFGALILVPSARIYAMDITGIGKRQRIDDVQAKPVIARIDPQIVMIGRDTRITVVGDNLTPQDKQLTVKIGTSDVIILSATPRQLSLDIKALKPQVRPYDLTLYYDGQKGPVGSVEFTTPPDLRMDWLGFDQQWPLKQGSLARARVSLTNQGDSTAARVEIKLQPGDSTTKIVIISDLRPFETRLPLFEFIYQASGALTAHAEARILSSNGQEIDTTNNSANLRVTVAPALAMTRVVDTTINIPLVKQGLVDTGIDLQPGDRLLMESLAKGDTYLSYMYLISSGSPYGLSGKHPATPDGIERADLPSLTLGQAEFPSLPILALLYKIGGSTGIAGILWEYNHPTASLTQRLYLRINTAGNMGAGIGSYDCHITVDRMK